MSQLSECSTIVYGLSQDPSFLFELQEVDTLYFQDSDLASTSSPPLNFSDSHSDSSDSESEHHDESDSDGEPSDNSIPEQPSQTPIEPTDVDVKFKDAVDSFRAQTCGCSHLYPKPCSTILNFEDLINLREFCASLDKQELDLIIKSSLYAHRKNDSLTSSDSGHIPKQRQKPSQRFFIKGQEVCRAVFCFAHGIHREKLMKLGQSLDQHGLQPRVHGNKRKLPHNALTVADRQGIVSFLERFAKENALPLPGRMPNHRDSRVLLLPSDKRQTDLHTSYLQLAEQLGLRKCGLTLFVSTWKELCPHITLTKPSTDLCHKCQIWNFKLSSSGGLPESEKMNIITSYQSHVNFAQQQRQQYRLQCEQSKQQFGPECVEGTKACTLNKTLHYSWDFAQQVLLPHHSQQIGPLYFKTPRKCEVFGVCCESSERQVFYLADEGLAPGKGPNTVISLVHHYLECYGFGETNAEFHFDNCSSQNKNNAVVWYALWRVMIGLHQTILYSLMVAGHTKFSPDMHFGIWKNRWRRVDAETIEDVAKSVRESSKNGHNIPHVASDVVFYNWKIFLGKLFKPLKNLSKYHSFKVSHTEPGVVVCKEYADSDEQKFMLLRKGVNVATDAMPEVVHGPGLDLERQWYLYDQVRSFFKSDFAKDKTCPKPSISKVPSTLKKKSKLPLSANNRRRVRVSDKSLSTQTTSNPNFWSYTLSEGFAASNVSNADVHDKKRAPDC